MNTYKFRTECQADADSLEGKLHTPIICLGDNEHVIKTTRSLSNMKLAIMGLNDCHVIYETILPIGEYTGERTYQS